MRALLCAVAGLAACVAHGQPILELSQECLGNCRAYRVAMYADGYVEFHGYQNVVSLEPELRTAHVDAANQAAIADAFARNGFASLENAQWSCPDDDGHLLSIKYRGHHIAFFDMCQAVPDAARLLFGVARGVLGHEDWFDGYCPKPLHLEPHE